MQENSVFGTENILNLAAQESIAIPKADGQQMEFVNKAKPM